MNKYLFMFSDDSCLYVEAYNLKCAIIQVANRTHINNNPLFAKTINLIETINDMIELFDTFSMCKDIVTVYEIKDTIYMEGQ